LLSVCVAVNIDEINIVMTAKPSRGVDPSWLTAAQTAARLGIKPATLYAYVSRGLIPRRRGPDRRTSYFAPADVERLARRTPHSRLAPTDIVVPTSISLVDKTNATLWYRGVDAVDATATNSFEAVAEFLWTGRWGDTGMWDADPVCVRTATRAQRAVPRTTSLLDRVGVIVAAARAADAHRTDRSPDGVVRTGRNLLSMIVESLPPVGPDSGGGLAARLWTRLVPSVPSRDEIRLLDTVLGLGAEHGVTLSVVAARIAASVGADVYAAVGAALGPASSAIETSSFPVLESFLAECERTGDPDAAVNAMVERQGKVIGISADPYRTGDPRARAILGPLRELRPERASIIDAAASALERQGNAEPDITFATAGVSFAFGCRTGSSELVTVVARIAGWIAHSIAEYRQPTPFRPHATYIGTPPAPEDREERRLLYAVMNYPSEE
jgi:citrate synthase